MGENWVSGSFQTTFVRVCFFFRSRVLLLLFIFFFLSFCTTTKWNEVESHSQTDWKCKACEISARLCIHRIATISPFRQEECLSMRNIEWRTANQGNVLVFSFCCHRIEKFISLRKWIYFNDGNFIFHLTHWNILAAHLLPLRGKKKLG